MSEDNEVVAQLTMDGAPVVVRRSQRRRRTVTAFRERGNVVVAIPASFTRAQERHWVHEMTSKLRARESRKLRSDADLMRRARELSDLYLDGRAVPTSVSWSTSQRRIWGNCVPASGVIRLNATLQQFPQWVQDYVIVHELAHLLRAQHDDVFWQLCAAYPYTERARGFLDGYSAAQDLGH